MLSNIKKESNIKEESNIKKEIKLKDLSIDFDESIKSEDESDREKNNSTIQILSDSAMPTLLSKKKKKVTAEQLKSWETEKVYEFDDIVMID